jgi:hypothetical protein
MRPYSESFLEQTDHDLAFTREFEQAIAKVLSPASPTQSLQTLLQACQWGISASEKVELTIHCSDSEIRTQIVSQLLEIAILLKMLFGSAKITVLGSHYPLETTTEYITRYYRY